MVRGVGVGKQQETRGVKMKTISAAFTLAGLLAMPAQAHHSFTANFDMSRQIELRGTVVDFKLRSPHSSMVVDAISYVDGVAQDDMSQRWEIESMATAGMRRMGVTGNTFKPGEAITILGNPNRQPEFRFINSSNFTLADGSIYNFRASEPYQEAGEGAITGVQGIDRLAGRWSSRGGFGNQMILPLTEQGRQVWEGYEDKLSPANTCEPMNFPDMFNAPYLADLRIEDGVAVIYNQAWEVERRIPLDGSPVRPRLDGLFGVVRAHVEGETLVLESGGYIPSLWGIGSATQKLGGGRDMPSSARKTLVEQFSVSADGNTLHYAYTISDPIYLAEPYSDSVDLVRVADSTPMYDYKCELEAASMWSRTADDPSLRVGE
jgi:hypothetical protein